jgi:hypothetical protein
MQQYKYRRKFPYNNTINEESAEHLSENKSTLTFASNKGNKRLFLDVSGRVVDRTHFSVRGRIINQNVMKSFDFEEKPEMSVGRRSENYISEFKYDSEDEMIQIEDLNNDSKKKLPDRFIKSSEDLPVRI